MTSKFFIYFLQLVKIYIILSVCSQELHLFDDLMAKLFSHSLHMFGMVVSSLKQIKV